MTEKEARRMAKDIISMEYEVVDEIWNRRRVNYASVAADYDQLTIREISRRMPNLLVKNGGVALDELAQEYHFASTCDLIDLFVNYTPKWIRMNQLMEQFFNSPEAETEAEIVDDMPF